MTQLPEPKILAGMFLALWYIMFLFEIMMYISLKGLS